MSEMNSDKVIALAESIAEIACKEVIGTGAAVLHLLNQGGDVSQNLIVLQRNLHDGLVARIYAEISKELAHLRIFPDTKVVSAEVPDYVRRLKLCDIGLNNRIWKALNRADVYTIGTLVDCHVADIMDMDGIGHKSVADLSVKLSECGVKWPLNSLPDELRSHRMERLDAMSLKDLSVKTTPGWLLNSLTVREIKKYRMERLRAASLDELRDLVIGEYDVIPYIIYRGLATVGIVTFGQLFEKNVKAYEDLSMLSLGNYMSCVADFAKIGRTLSGQVIESTDK